MTADAIPAPVPIEVVNWHSDIQKERIRQLESALSDCETIALAASARLSFCLSIKDEPHREQVTGMLARLNARAFTARNYPKGA